MDLTFPWAAVEQHGGASCNGHPRRAEEKSSTNVAFSYHFIMTSLWLHLAKLFECLQRLSILCLWFAIFVSEFRTRAIQENKETSIDAGGTDASVCTARKQKLHLFCRRVLLFRPFARLCHWLWAAAAMLTCKADQWFLCLDNVSAVLYRHIVWLENIRQPAVSPTMLSPPTSYIKHIKLPSLGVHPWSPRFVVSQEPCQDANLAKSTDGVDSELGVCVLLLCVCVLPLYPFRVVRGYPWQIMVALQSFDPRTLDFFLSPSHFLSNSPSSLRWSVEAWARHALLLLEDMRRFWTCC